MANERSRAGDGPGPGSGRRRRPGELESQVLGVLVDAAGALTAGEVRERLRPSGRLSYSAVLTTLTRLHAKEAVTRHRAGRAFRYAAVDASALVAMRMRRLLDGEEDHALVLTRFISALDPGDEEIVRRLLGGSEPPAADGPGTAAGGA